MGRATSSPDLRRPGALTRPGAFVCLPAGGHASPHPGPRLTPGAILPPVSESVAGRSRLSEEDFRLSVAVSRRPKTPRPDEHLLRSLLVDRLTNTKKAVGRVSLKDGALAIFCEGCHRWRTVEEFPVDYDCDCGRRFVMEFCVYEEVE